MREYRKVIQELKKEVEIPEMTKKQIRQTLSGLPERKSVGPEKKLNREKKHLGGLMKLVAASLAVALFVGTTAYAAKESMLLSLFSDESEQVQKNAEKLIDTEVSQVDAEQSKISEWVSTKVLEAVCDKNSVIVEIEVKPKEPEKYLLVPLDAEIVGDLRLPDTKNTMETIQDFAKKNGQKEIPLSMDISYEKSEEPVADSLSIDFYMKKDGTVIFTFEFANQSKDEKLNYQYDVVLSEPDKDSDEVLRESFAFTLNDTTESEIIRYLPTKKDQKVKGTNLVVEEVTFEKSALSTAAKVRYRYVGTTMDQKKWDESSQDAETMFFYFDKKGKQIEWNSSVNGGGGTALVEGEDGQKNSVYEQTDTLSSSDLPERIILRAKNVFEKVEYGEIELKRE